MDYRGIFNFVHIQTGFNYYHLNKSNSFPSRFQCRFSNDIYDVTSSIFVIIVENVTWMDCKERFFFKLIKRNINAIASIKLGIQDVSETGAEINIYI